MPQTGLARSYLAAAANRPVDWRGVLSRYSLAGFRLIPAIKNTSRGLPNSVPNYRARKELKKKKKARGAASNGAAVAVPRPARPQTVAMAAEIFDPHGRA